MIRNTDGATTKMEAADTQDRQLADDSVSLDLRLNLISQVREAFTLVNEITEGNRQIINKLDHFQNDSFNKPDLPNKSKEITECKFQANNVVQYPMENAKRSDCAKAIETADTLSMKLDAFCKMFEEQTCLERRPTPASQSNSVKVDPLSVVFCSGLRRKHIYEGDDNSVVLFLSGDFHTDGKSPIVIHAPNVRKGIHISRCMNLEAEKFKQYPGSPTPTTTTTLTAATTKETQSANASTIQMMATAMTTKATAGQATEGKTDRATSQACPSADNITGQLRRNQTKIKDDNRLVSYEAQIERQAYKPLAKNKNDGGFNAGGRQNRLNGFKGARYQSVQDERRVPMSKNMIPKKNWSSEQGSQNSGGYRLGSDQTLNLKEQLNSRDMLSSSESMKIRKNARETVSAENVRIGDSKSQASVPKQWKGTMDTHDRVCPSEILNKREGTEGKMSEPLKKQTDVNITESALESTKKYNRHSGADKKMYGEDSMSALEISRTQGNSTATLSAVESSHNRNGDKSVRHTSELLKKQNVTKNTLFTSKTSIKQGNTSDIMSASELHKKHNDISQTESTSKLLKKYSDSKGTVPTTGLTKSTLLAEETAVAMELSRTRVSTGDEISSSQRSKEDRAGNSKSNSSVKTSGIIIDSTQGKSSKETYNHSTRGVHQGTVKNPTQVAPQVEEDTAQGLDLMPIVRQYWDMFSGDSSICSQLDAAGMKMELLNPDVSDPNKPLQFKYKLEEFGFEQTVEVKMSDMLAMQAQGN